MKIRAVPEMEAATGECSLLQALPVHPATDAARGVQLAVSGLVLADGLKAYGALTPGGGRLRGPHRLLGRPVREAERRELAVVLLHAAVGLSAGQVVALLALLARATHRRALALAVDALEAGAPLHLRPDLRGEEASEAVVLVVPALPQPGGEEEAEVMRAHPVGLEQVVVQAAEAGFKLAAQEARGADTVRRSRAVLPGGGGMALHEPGAPADAGPLPRRPVEGESHRRRGRPRPVLLAGRRRGHHPRGGGGGKVTHELALPLPIQLPVS